MARSIMYKSINIRTDAGCGHCKKMKPEYTAAAARLTAEEVMIVFTENVQF